MKCERDVKERVKAILNELGIWWFMYVPTGYGEAGIPDFLCCVNGRFLAIETKFGNKKPTALQARQMGEIEKAAGVALVINEKNVGELEKALKKYVGRTNPA